MGRKKQKVRWTSVEDAGFFDSELSNSENTNPQNFEKTANQQPGIQSGFHQENFNQSAAGPGGLVVVNSQQYHHQNNSNHHTSEQNIPEQLTSQNNSVTSTTIPNQYLRSVSDNSSMRRGNFVKYSNGPGGGGSDRGGNGSTSRRSGGGGYWSNASLPPRFERSKQTSISNSSIQGGAGSEQYELDSNFETEELPNGFTKIRSKNLDVLFRKDYYAQRMLSTTSSSAVSSEAGEPVSASEIQETDLDVINLNTEPTIQENEEEIEQELNSENDGQSGKISKEATPSSTKEATPFSEKIPEVTKKPVEIKSKINTNAVPFYPSTYVPPLAQSAANTSYQIVNGGVASTPSGNAQQQATPNQSTSRPSLFLYSPSSNTMIPCEEIIIPNAVMPGTDVYQGPSNIYLAFPTDGNAPGGQGQQQQGHASQSPVSGNGSVTSPGGGTSSNCSPPQAQSPPHSYIDATGVAGGPGTLQATPTTATPAMVQYDHYGVPYTTYTPVMPNSSQSIANGDQQATPTGCASISSGGMASADCSSADSTTPHSPPDLSVYNPANWVPDPAYLAQAAAGGVTGATPPHPGVVAQQAGHAHPYQYYPYYQHHHPSSYYNFRNGHASYHQYLIESSAVPSSAGESQNEDRSEGEDTSTTSPNTATTTTSNSPKKEPSLPSHGGVASTIQSSGALLNSSNNIGHHSHKQQQSDSLLNDNTSKPVFIPGLPVTNLKRPPKKRRKKKPSSANPNSSNSSSGTGTLLTTINGNSDHRGSTDSGENEKNNVLQAITILQRSEGQQANGFSEEPLDSTTEPAENSAEMEDSEEILDDDQTPDPNAEHVNDEPVEPEQDQRVTEIEAEIIPEDAKILSDKPNLPPLKESFKEILVKQVFDEEILIVTQSETKTTLIKNITPEPETKPAEKTFPADLSENNTDLSNADIDEQQKTEIAENNEQETTKENSPKPITNSPIAENEGHEGPEGIATPSPTPNNNLIDETEPDLVPEVSIKQPARSHHRRRRGARKSEKNKKQNPNYSGQNSVEGGQTENESGETTLMQQQKEIIPDDNNKSVTGTNSQENAQCAQKRAQIEKQPGWEMVPKEIIADPDSGWETATRKGGRQRVLHVTPIDSRDVTPSDVHRVSMDPRIVAEKITEEAASNQSDSEPNSKAESEVKDDTIEILKTDPMASALDIESQNGHPDSGLSPPSLASASLPASRKSTLKRTNRKKRASQGDLSAGANAGGDGKGTSTPASGSSLSKPVLISDRDYDVASAIAAQRRYKSAFDVLDESKIKDLVNQGSSGTHPNAGAGQDGKAGTGNGTFDTLYISDIGYGMNGGPISMGRFGLGKYMPPDRSNEIQSLENPSETNKTANEETNENTPNDTIKDNDDNPDDLEQSAQDIAGSDKSSIIKAMMDQVIRASSGGNVNKISGINPAENLDRSGNGSAGGSPTNGSNLTYIRDAERFTEISAVTAKLEPELAGSKIAQCLTPTKTSTITSTTIPTVKENPILKSQELDLD